LKKIESYKETNLVYPEVNDWSVELEIYAAEVSYSKYGNFDTHKMTFYIH